MRIGGFPGSSDNKESACNAGDPGSERSPGERNGFNPLQVFLPEEPHGQRSLEGYSPWGHKELDMTEATEHAHTHRLTISQGEEQCLPLI